MSFIEERGISTIPIKEEMDTSYLDYAMSVIIGRALPDVRDGLKPVHRRVLYAMFREGLLHNKRFSKCAGVVGEVLKKYHPHGDSAVYDTLVRMAQPWNLRYPLVHGQGNFGSIDGDSAAAYRYTESKMTHLAEMMLQDIDKETVDFIENYDGSTFEPTVLPTLFPTLLVNGSDGIAVGMATKIPPHNLGEIMNACIHLIDFPETTSRELFLGKTTADGEVLPPWVQGPDFPTGGQVIDRGAILQAYETGRGIVKMRGTCEIEEEEEGRSRIVITEVPYQVNKARLVEKIAELVRDKKVEGIRPGGLRDETNRQGIRVVIELKKDAHPEVVLNQLYKHSPLESSFGIIMLSIVEGKPRLLGLKEMLEFFLQHRREVTIRRTRFELRKAQARAHILEGLVKALSNIDQVIETIRANRSTQEARLALQERFDFSEEQAKAILEMRLQKLTGMEQEDLMKELEALLIEIHRLKEILSEESILKELMKSELETVKNAFSDVRRCKVMDAVDSISIQDLIPDEDMVVTLTNTGYIKRSPLSEYKAQKRGGKGVKGAQTHTEDFITEMFVASAHEYLLIFTNKGRLYVMSVWEIPETSKTSKGRPLVNMINFDPDETPKTVRSLREFEEGKFVFFATKQGTIKKTPLMAYSNMRSNGIIAINLDEGDELIGVDITDGTKDIILGTKNELAIRFKEEDARPIGRTARGVRGIRLDEGNEVVSLVVTDEEHDILTISVNGYGKRTAVTDYRITKRGGKGIFSIKPSERNGSIAGHVDVTDGDQLMISTDQGKMIRIRCNDVRTQGRNTQGLRLFHVDENENVISVARIVDEDEDELSVEYDVEQGSAENIEAVDSSEAETL